MVAPHSTDPAEVAEVKRALRRRMLLRRQTDDNTTPLIASILSAVPFVPGCVVAGVWPLPGEPDLRPLWHHLHGRGHRLVLPETPPRGEALRFRAWHPDCAMVAGRFATRHPDHPSGTGLLPEPDLVFVPLLAFDRAGYRLGYGGGYYDRTLAALPRACAVGYGFSFQQVEAVPRGPFDLPLSIIVTETGIVTASGRVPIER